MKPIILNLSSDVQSIFHSYDFCLQGTQSLILLGNGLGSVNETTFCCKRFLKSEVIFSTKGFPKANDKIKIGIEQIFTFFCKQYQRTVNKTLTSILIELGDLISIKVGQGILLFLCMISCLLSKQNQIDHEIFIDDCTLKNLQLDAFKEIDHHCRNTCIYIKNFRLFFLSFFEDHSTQYKYGLLIPFNHRFPI